jgi:hypothetical protein
MGKVRKEEGGMNVVTRDKLIDFEGREWTIEQLDVLNRFNDLKPGERIVVEQYITEHWYKTGNCVGEMVVKTTIYLEKTE